MSNGDDPARRQALIDLLSFYEEAGVDCALEENGVDRASLPERSPLVADPKARRRDERRSVPPARSSPPPAETPSRKVSPGVVLPDERAVSAAREEARAARTLAELKEVAIGFKGMNLKNTARQIAFEDGHAGARLMLVGEAPGRDEDREGKPFVGRSGQLLDLMMAAIGLKRETDFYLANVVPWRPPGNRTPTPQEVEICRPFIERQIELVAPDFLLPLGGAAAKVLLKTDVGITRLRGRWHDYQAGERMIRAMPTLHPAYLLRQPLQKRLAWRDLLDLQAAMAS